MSPSIVKAALAALATAWAIHAAPAADVGPPNRGDGTFTLASISNENFQKSRLSLISTYLKHGVDLLPEERESLDRCSRNLVARGSQEGSVEARPPSDFDSEYVVPVQIGTPPQSIPMTLDTGSRQLWAFSADTDMKPPPPSDKPRYTPQSSETGQLVEGATWKTTYGFNLGASGTVYNDRVQLDKVFVESQAVGSAHEASPCLLRTISSGVMGMAFTQDDTATPPQPSLLYNLKDRLKLPLFTADLKRGRVGRYNFGFIDKSEYTGKIAYAKILNWKWTIQVSGFQVGKDKASSRGFKTIVDTGSSGLFLPDAIVTEYYNRVKGAGLHQGMYTFPCSAKLPDFTFTIGSYKGTVPGNYMNYQKENQTHCLGGIQPSRGSNEAIFGIVLLKAQFIVFNFGEGKVGFAKKKLKK